MTAASDSSSSRPGSGGVTWADRLTAKATAWTAIFAVVAITISIVVYVDQRQRTKTEYASRVSLRKMNILGDFSIENRSTATLSFGTLQYIPSTVSTSERTRQIFKTSTPGVTLTSIPPCTRLEFDHGYISRKIVGAAGMMELIAGRPDLPPSDINNFDAFITGVVFNDPHGRWVVQSDGTGVKESKAEVYGAPMEPIPPAISSSATLSDCGPS